MLLAAGLVIAAAVVAAVFLLPGYLRQLRNDEIRAGGVAATATVTALVDTGQRRGLYVPMTLIRIEVLGPDGARFPAEVRMAVSVVDLPRLQTGATVQVRYDRQDRSRVVVLLN